MAKQSRSPRQKYQRRPRLDHEAAIPNALQISTILAPLDQTAASMERRWGVERLPGLVNQDLANRFAMARQVLDDALDQGDLPAIETAAANLRKGWTKLDEVATAAGAAPYDPTAWGFEVCGKPCAIVIDDSGAKYVQQIDPGRTVWTLDEIGNLLSAYLPTIAPMLWDAKQAFPGATVGVRPASTPEAPPRTVGAIIDDEIPF